MLKINHLKKFPEHLFDTIQEKPIFIGVLIKFCTNSPYFKTVRDH